MTDTIQPSEFSSAIDDYREKDLVASLLRAQTLPANKTALFSTLAKAGITVVTVAFDGQGDSGQIENIEPLAGDIRVPLPSGTIDLAKPVWGKNEIEHSTLSIRDAIETMVYDFLGETHGGWEDNDGAYGEVTFDVEDQTITLAFNERFIHQPSRC